MKLDEAIKQAQADVTVAERKLDRQRKIRKALGDIQASKEILGGHFVTVTVDVHGLQTPGQKPTSDSKYLTWEMIDQLPVGTHIVFGEKHLKRESVRSDKYSWVTKNSGPGLSVHSNIRELEDVRLADEHPPLTASNLSATVNEGIAARIVTEAGEVYSTGLGGLGWRVMDAAGDCTGDPVDVDWLAARNPRPCNPLLAEDQQKGWWTK